MNETKMLRAILTAMLLDSRCREVFEWACSEGFAMGVFTSYGSNCEDAERWLRAFRDRLLSESDELKSDVIKREADIAALELEISE